MADVQVATQPFSRDDLFQFLPNWRLLTTFENLAQDVSTTIPEAIATSVVGPTGAIDGDIPVFDGTTGYVVRDSGIQVTSLAPLNSPVFTGIPQAPTAAPGTSTAQLATTAFVEGEIAGKVDGPASSVNNDIALFNGATGKIVKDSGVQLAAVALLASPTFTGNPLAPTAALNDNDTSIATTAFVQAQLNAGSLNAKYFSAHNNGTTQSIPTVTPTALTFSTTLFNVGTGFAANAWTPPASRPVSISGICSITLTGSGAAYVSIFKNGVEFKRGSQTLFTGLASNALALDVSIIDVPNGTDVYTLVVSQSTGSAMNTNGGAALTWFQGSTITP